MSDPFGTPPTNPYGPPSGPPYAGPPYGGPPYGTGPYAGGPVGPPKTDGISIAALVASLLGLCTGIGFLVGLVLGIVGLSRTKNGQRAGRGLAISGIVIGAIGVVVGIAVVVALGVWGVKSVVTPSNAQVGQCIDGADGGRTTGTFLKVPCSLGHEGEIVAVGEVTQADLAHGGAGACSRLMTADVRAALAGRRDLTLYFTNSRGGYVGVGDRIVCYVVGKDLIRGDLLH